MSMATTTPSSNTTSSKPVATQSAYTKILSKKQIKPREVELALTYDSNNNPIINQRSSVLKSKSQEPVARREVSPKKKPEPQSPARKRLYKNTEGSLEVSFSENIKPLTYSK